MINNTKPRFELTQTFEVLFWNSCTGTYLVTSRNLTQTSLHASKWNLLSSFHFIKTLQRERYVLFLPGVINETGHDVRTRSWSRSRSRMRVWGWAWARGEGPGVWTVSEDRPGEAAVSQREPGRRRQAGVQTVGPAERPEQGNASPPGRCPGRAHAAELRNIQTKLYRALRCRFSLVMESAAWLQVL